MYQYNVVTRTKESAKNMENSPLLGRALCKTDLAYVFICIYKESRREITEQKTICGVASKIMNDREKFGVRKLLKRKIQYSL